MYYPCEQGFGTRKAGKQGWARVRPQVRLEDAWTEPPRRAYGSVDYHGRGSLSELSADKSWFCLIDEAIWLTDTNITQDTFVVDVQIRLEILSAGLSNRVYSCHQQRTVLLTGADVLQVGCDVGEAAHRMRVLGRYAPSGIQATVQRPPDDDHVILGAVYGQRFRRTEYIWNKINNRTRYTI